VNSLSLGAAGKILVSGGSDHTIRIWDLEKGNLLTTLTGHQGVVNSVVLNAAGKTLVSGSFDRSVRVWSLPKGALSKTLADPVYSILAAAITPDGEQYFGG
jgi:WD40 repeat protein